MVVPPSAKEKEVLKAFRGKISDLTLDGSQNSDLYLLSWLRARDLDLAKAESMFRTSLEWRKVNKIDDLPTWKPPEIFETEFPFQISGYDKEKCPVGVIPNGSWDVRKMIEKGERETYIKYCDYMYSKFILSSEGGDDEFVQFNVIFDMAGYSFRQLTGHGCVDVTLETVKRFEANYPERLKRCYIINAPKIFSILFALIKPLLSPVTLAKIVIYGSNASKWKLALLNNIPADQIPIAYGGTATVDLKRGDATKDKEEGEMNEMIEVTVGAGEKLEVQYKIKHANSKISWRFKTIDYDIGFSLKFENNEEIVKYERVESFASEQCGSFLCEKTGNYTLLFDNMYSVVRPKTLFYIVTVESPEDSDEEEVTSF